MYRAGLLAVLLLAVAAAAGWECRKISEYDIYTTDNITVRFKFEAIAPVLPGYAVRSKSNLLYSDAVSAKWDKPLVFNVTLEHYAPDQPWIIGTYMCVYRVNGTIVDVRTYEELERRPERVRTTITFTVPATAAKYEESTVVRVSQPLRRFGVGDNYFISARYPSWHALQVNGYKPGDVVEAYGVNATIPNPWEYGIYSNVGTFSYVEIDGNRSDPNVRNVPVSSSVYLHMVGMPTVWGSVNIRQTPNIPVYVARWVRSSDPPATFCRPPSCIILTWHNTTCFVHGYRVPIYDALVAVRSGNRMSSLTTFSKVWHSEIRLPLGSVYLATIYTEWFVPHPIFGEIFAIYLRERFGGGSMYLRVIRGNTYYEDVASRGKVNGPLSSSGRLWWRTAEVAVAVDRSVPSIELGVYTWPVPTYYALVPTTTIYRDTWDDAESCPGPVLTASAWLTDALRTHHPDISGGRYVDLLHYLYGEPVVYYWGQGDQYGAVSVHTEPRYEQTTADAAGRGRLYYVKGIAPTDTAVLDMSWSTPQIVDKGDDEEVKESPWLVALVPTTACRSMFCTSLSPELVGPLPPIPGDRALPNTGYSIMLMYTGPTGRHRVKVYVEDGYVISSGPPINVARARNYKLVEIDKVWRPLETVIVGPGWWVPFRQLDTCRTMPLNTSSIYATPDRTGFVKIIVEDNGRNSTYVFYVTDRVAYHITTRTPAPESLTSTPFNMTAYVTLGGVPYYHAVYGYGEGGRLSPPTCVSTWFHHYLMPQLALSGDFWGTFGLAHMLLKPVNIQYIYAKPRLELADPWRGLVRLRADGPVSGFAFYAQRGGTWVKIGEAAGSCLLVNASRLFPWDPILVLPLVEQELTARPGDTVTIWRPETALLFKTWADVVGYPKGARSVLSVVGAC